MMLQLQALVLFQDLMVLAHLVVFNELVVLAQELVVIQNLRVAQELLDQAGLGLRLREIPLATKGYLSPSFVERVTLLQVAGT
ncbi:hypothetical protein ACSSS7_002496 [Eimeria intestinalis]